MDLGILATWVRWDVHDRDNDNMGYHGTGCTHGFAVAQRQGWIMSFFRGLHKLNSILFFCRQGERLTSGLTHSAPRAPRVVRAGYALCKEVCPVCYGEIPKRYHCPVCFNHGFILKEKKA